MIRDFLRRHFFETQWYFKHRYPRYRVGSHTYGFPAIFAWGSDAVLQIGRYCSIARGVEIFLGGEHRTDWVTTYPFNILSKSGIRPPRGTSLSAATFGSATVR